MDKPKNQLITEKSIRLLQQNQYTFHVDSKLTKTEMKSWIEQIFEVKIEGINSSRVRTKKKTRLNSNYASTKKIIIKIRPNSFLPLFLN